MIDYKFICLLLHKRLFRTHIKKYILRHYEKKYPAFYPDLEIDTNLRMDYDIIRQYGNKHNRVVVNCYTRIYVTDRMYSYGVVFVVLKHRDIKIKNFISFMKSHKLDIKKLSSKLKYSTLYILRNMPYFIFQSELEYDYCLDINDGMFRYVRT